MSTIEHDRQRPPHTVGADESPRVFLSYRRDDSADVAERLAAHLRDDIGFSCVFRDQDDLIGGQDWRHVLRASISTSDATLCLIGPDWAAARDDGTRRIDDRDDPVRQEVALALDPGTPTSAVPVVLGGAVPPAELPDDISPTMSATAARPSIAPGRSGRSTPTRRRPHDRVRPRRSADPPAGGSRLSSGSGRA